MTRPREESLASHATSVHCCDVAAEKTKADRPELSIPMAAFLCPSWPLSTRKHVMSNVHMNSAVDSSKSAVDSSKSVVDAGFESQREYESPSLGKARYRMRVSYDGGNYSGWQFQGNQRTVQGEIERCINRRIQTLVRVVGASRTDTGLHARGQMAHFDIPASCRMEDVAKFEFALNQMLPRDIRVRELERAPTQFSRRRFPEQHGDKPWHAIYCAKSKLYTYRISTGVTFDPLERPYRHYEWRAAQRGFDPDVFQRAVDVYIGTHDFTSFTNTTPSSPGKVDSSLVRNPVRTVESATVVDEGDGRYRVDFVLTGALYRMVRNMVGGALDVACGCLTVTDLERILESRCRHGAPKSAPACGLCLERVFYDE